jgi:DNA-binding response OmpR family regulator
MNKPKDESGKKVYELLAIKFEQHPHAVLHFEAVIQFLYGPHDVNRKSARAYARVAVMNCREILKDKGTINNVRGHGYKFVPKGK